MCSSFEYHLIVFTLGLRRKSNCSCSVQSFFEILEMKNDIPKNYFKANIWKVSH